MISGCISKWLHAFWCVSTSKVLFIWKLNNKLKSVSNWWSWQIVNDACIPFSPLRFISADIATCCCFSFSLSNSLLPLFQIKSLDCVGSFCNILGETISAQSTLLCCFPAEFSANAQVQRLVALRYETGMVFVLCVFFFRFWVGIQEIKDAIKLQSFFSTKLELSSMIHHKCRTI